MANAQGQAFDDLRYTVSEGLRIVRQRYRLSLVGLSLVATVAFWCSQYLPRQYVSSTLFERRDDIVLQNLVTSNSPYGFGHLKTTMAMDMTGSRALARALAATGLLPADTFGGGPTLAERERGALDAAVERYGLRADMKLIHSTSSLDTILLTCRANDPAIARQMVVALRDGYIAETRERMRVILSSAKQFFENEVARLQREVTEAECSLRKDFDEFPGLDPLDLAGVGTRLEMLRTQRDTLYQRKAGLDADVAAREEFMRAAPEADAGAPRDGSRVAGRTPAVNPVDETLDRAVETVQREIVDLLTTRRMTTEHPAVKNLYARLEALHELRQTLASSAQTPPTGVPLLPPLSETYRQWQAQRMRVELELDALRPQAAMAAAQLAEAEQRVERFDALYRQLLERNEGLRAQLDQRAKAAAELAIWQGHLAGLGRILSAETGSRGTEFTLLEEPEEMARPTMPRLASVFGVCSGLGLAAAVLLAALAELFDRSFRSAEQLTRSLGVPVLAMIGVIPTRRHRRSAALARMFWTPALGLLLLALLASATLAYTSLELPGWHARAMQRIERALDAAGVRNGQ